MRTIKIVLNALIELQVARHMRNAPKEQEGKVYVIRERDSDNAFEAMCVLGIAVPNPDYPEPDYGSEGHEDFDSLPNYCRILLTQWGR